MSSQTPNLNLVLPIGTEKVSRQIINDNNTKIDTAVGSNSQAIAKVQNGLAFIVGNTNTTGGTLAVGQFVYVKGHSTITEGLRTVTASISANGNITTSNTSACSEGGLNALNSKLMCSGYMEWNDITLSSSSWTTNTGHDSSGVKPSGAAQDDSYNLLLDIAGTYLVIYYAEIADSTNKTGLRGIRQYVTETNIHEFFFAPGGNNTTCEASCIVHSNGSDTVRMGVYQSSGGSLTVTNIRVMAVMLKRD